MENKIVPKLRFPEFFNEKVWNERKLSDVLIEHSSKSTGVEKVFSVSVHKGLINQIEHLGRNFSARTTDHYKRVLPGDIVYTKSPTGEFPFGIIKQSKIAIPVIVSPLYGVFTPETYALGCILDAYFTSPVNVSNYLSSIIQKGAKNTINISNKTFLSKALFLPVNKNEQQKVADCLSSLDDLLSLQSEKLDALKLHKKAMMQQLFPTDGETVPKLRFAEFKDSGEWEFLNGNQVFEPISNKKHNSDLPILAITQEYGAIPRANIDYNVIVSDRSIVSYKVVEIGDFIISLRSFQGGIEYSNYKGICSPAYIILRKKINVIDNFFKHYFKTSLFIQYLNRNIEGIRDGKMVSYKQFSEILLPTPKQEEQKKIADCLSSLDELILAQSKKIEALKAHKKGLMQGLFPKIGK